MDVFAPYLKKNGCFIVRNITPDRKKTIKIFNYPILFNQTRDLLQIPGVAEADIRASLLKGELNHKIIVKDIIIECSDIDLLQFNNDQKIFLQNAGVVIGLEVSSSDGYGITASDHEILRQLIHFIDSGGPADGFTSGAFREILPYSSPFPTSVTWYVDATKIQKIVEKFITYTFNDMPDTITWNMYKPDGVTIVHTVIDTITYTNNIFESTRTRTIL